MTHPLENDFAETHLHHPLDEPDPREQEAAQLREAREQGRIVPIEFPNMPRRPYLTYALLAINLLIFGVGMLSPDLNAQLLIGGWLYPYGVVEQGEWWRLFTLMFLHANLAHIFMNGSGLYSIGSEIELTFGRTRFLLIYFLGGLLGSILQLLLGGDSVGLGASGALFALVGAKLIYWRQHRDLFLFGEQRLQNLLVVAGLNLVVGFMYSDIIGTWAHMGGFVGGLLLAWRIAPHYSVEVDKSAPPPKSLLATDSNPLVRRHVLEIAAYFVGLLLLCGGAALLLHPQAFDFVAQ
jgi:membrane associated rhomboid family serine protease